MRRVLCLITTSADPLSETIISAQQTQPDCAVETFQLDSATDYEKLLDAIFAADSVQVW
jgi:hypothetical protein